MQQVETRPQWKLRAFGGASAIALLAIWSVPQSAAAQAAPATTQVEGVVVTASRIVRDGYEAPTPTTVLGAAAIEKNSPSNIADYVNQLPQLGSAASYSPRTVNYAATIPGGGANSLNLRNLGVVRTLTLLDGHRVVPAVLIGITDINLLPTNLVSRVDVVTGGASAAWGSDAVAGVVNFVLDKQFVGLKGSVSYGSSWRGDASLFSGDVAYGGKFGGDRGHVLLSGRIEYQDAISANSSRDWYVGIKAVPNSARTATNGQPGFNAQIGGLRLATTGGVITAGPLAGIQFGPGGTVLPYRFATNGAGLIGSGGDVQDVGGEYGILPVTKNESLFGRVSYDITDHANIYAEAGVGWDYGVNYSSQFIRHGDLAISTQNPFIPAALVIPAGLTTFNIGRVQDEQGLGPTRAKNTRRQERFVVGGEGDIDWFNNSFKWNAYYQHGKTFQYQEVSHNAIVANFLRAVDAVRNPAVGGVPGIAAGTPVCRSTITNPNNGCQPFNVFGAGSPSKASIAYVAGNGAYQHIELQQDVASAGFQFEPLTLPAGPVSLAGGVEWRKEQYHNSVDALDADPATYGAAPFFFGNYKVGRGKYNVKEGFAEIIVPILKDAPLIKSLDFNGAVRETDYSTSGRVTTWKAGGTWDVTDDLRFRGTRSRDIRAPNLSDLFSPGGGGGVGVFTPGTNAQVFTTTVGGGNPTLVPEIAKTTAFGVVYRPSWFRGFNASIDRYKISIGNAIVTQTAQQIVNLCYGVGQVANPNACTAITLGPLAPSLAGALIRTGGANIAKAEVAGYDIEIGYRSDLSELYEPLAGVIDIRAVGSHLTKFTQTIGGTTSNYKGMVASGNLPTFGGPEWRWLLTTNYTLGPSSTTATIRYVGKAVVNNEPRNSSLAVDKNNIKPFAYLDLNQSWDLALWGSRSQVFVQVQNVFDTDPPIIANTAGSAYASSGTDGAYYDLIGRFWRVGMRFKY